MPIRALLGELYFSAGPLHKEALAEFEASSQVVPNRFPTSCRGSRRSARYWLR